MVVVAVEVAAVVVTLAAMVGEWRKAYDGKNVRNVYDGGGATLRLCCDCSLGPGRDAESHEQRLCAAFSWHSRPYRPATPACDLTHLGSP